MKLINDIERILFTFDDISSRCKELGKEITKDYENKKPILIGVLKGAVPFMELLMESIDLHISIDYVICSSYNNCESTGFINIIKNVDCDIKGKDIILVEDIIDTGLTIKVLKEMFESKGAASVKIATLLEKKEAHKYTFPIDYVAFQVQNQFVVGFGLDYNQYYRNLPFIGILKPEIYSKKSL